MEELQGVSVKLHVAEQSEGLIPDEWFAECGIVRAEGEVMEPQTEVISGDRLGEEWEWEESPELTLTLVPDVETAIRLFNEQSPKFAASLISEDADEHERFFNLIDSPFVGGRDDALGGRAVRVQPAGAGAVQLAVRAAVRAGRGALW